MVGKIRISRKNKYTIDLILGLKCPDEGSATILGEEDILVELCESVTECKDDTGELHFKTMPKLQVASIFHKGSYNTLATSYESVLRYVEENGYEIVGAIRESYIDGVWNKEDESEWLTEIQVPIRKITGEEMSDKIFVP